MWRTTNLEVVGLNSIVGDMFVQLVVWRTTNLEAVGLKPIEGIMFVWLEVLRTTNLKCVFYKNCAITKTMAFLEWRPFW